MTNIQALSTLEKKRVVVLGGSEGIGLAVAQGATALGASVIIASRSLDKLNRAAAKISGPVETYSVDFTHEDEVAELFQKKIQHFDHLVVTAFTFGGGSIVKLPVSKAKAFFEGKFWGAYYAAKYAAPYLSESGSITFFSGNMCIRPGSGVAAGVAAGGALEALGRCLAVELAPIRVNVISPGMTQTPSWDLMSEEERDRMFVKAKELIPVPRIAQPEDIAHAVLSIVTSSYINGIVLVVDGGEILSTFPQPEIVDEIDHMTHH